MECAVTPPTQVQGSRPSRNWPRYYAATKNAEPRETLVQALQRFENLPRARPRFAVDLGCGGGADTRELLAHGWRVLAIDGEPSAIEQVRSTAGQHRRRLQTRVAAFEAAWWPTADLVNASLALPFCPPDATSSIPLVMIEVSDPIERGFATSLSHPGGQATGLTAGAPGLAAKRLELLTDLVPDPRPTAVVYDPADAVSRRDWQEVEASGRARGLQLEPVEVSDQSDFMLDLITRDLDAVQPKALLVLGQYTLIDFGTNRSQILKYSLEHMLPGMYFFRKWVFELGLMAYGPSEERLHRAAATYIDRILRGARPSELAIEQSSAFELVVSSLMLNALHLTLPAKLASLVTESVR